jgi:hypothetical protein
MAQAYEWFFGGLWRLSVSAFKVKSAAFGYLKRITGSRIGNKFHKKYNRYTVNYQKAFKT